MRRLAVLLGVVALLGACSPPSEDTERIGIPPEVAAQCRHVEGNLWWCPDEATPTTTTSTTASSTTTTTTTPPQEDQPDGPPGTWRLVWNDEFEGSSLDLSKWRPNWLGGSDSAVTPPVNTLEESCYDPGHVRVSGGLLHLTADRNTPSGCRTRSGSSASYASGLVQTNGRYNFTYGYVEARINIPGTCGRGENWPAFWTNGQNWPRDGEIDIMEVLDGSSTWHYHWSSGSAGGRGDHLSCESGWHTFGVLWEPGRLTFYYDGEQVGTHTRGVVSTRHYIILNHALSSEISPPVRTPSTLQIDWVRHWQRN